MGVAMTKKELANVAGYSYQRLYMLDRDLEKDKKLFVASEEDPKKCDLAMFVQRWVEYNRREKEEESTELSAIKAQHEKVKKEKTEIEVARMKGEVVEVQAVDRLWSNIASVVRGRFVGLPKKLAASLVMIESPDRIEEILDREVRDALVLIAQTPLPGGEFDVPTSEEDDDRE